MTDHPAPPIAIFGEVLYDCFPDGRRVLGGAPFNVAWHLTAFGANARFISAVGEDPPGAAVRAAMTAWGMETAAVQTDPAHATGEVRVTIHSGEPAYDIVPDRAFDHIRPIPLSPRPALLYHGTLALRQPVSAAALGELRSAGAGLRFVDVNLRDPWWSSEDTLALIAGADWVKLNRDELNRLSGDPPGPGDDCALREQAVAFRARHGLTGLVVTLGADGALMVPAAGEPLRLPASPPPALADTVGAGDAFAAVLILGLTRGWPLPDTLERALGFAARICAQPGATAADRGLYRGFGWAGG